MSTFSDKVSRMRSVLAVTMPDLDTSIGTVARKMIDAFCEVLDETQIDQYLIQYQYDIDSLSGQALDDMVRLFGFSRLPARRAVGEITFERSLAVANVDKDIQIPAGGRFTTDGIPPVVVATTIPALLLVGDNVITVPATAVDAGSAGNIVANSLKRVASPLSGISGFNNLSAFTGGTDAESDEKLRSRFKKTVFRNLAGTEDQVLGVALENLSAVAANVIGPIKRHREQIELTLVSGGPAPASGTYSGDSTIANAKYVYDPAEYAGTAFFGADLEGDDFLQHGSIWTMNITDNPDGTVTPTIEIVSTTDFSGIYELDFSYVPRASRNIPADNITNRVDVWVDGTDEVEATETVKYDESLLFTDTDTDRLYRGNFRRRDQSIPLEDNLFIPLHFTPVINPSINDAIVIDGETYVEDVDYWVVNNITAEGMSPQSDSGLEWNLVTAPVVTQPADGKLFPVTYTYNAVPLQIEKALQNWRLLTMDFWVHASIPILLDINLAVILNEGANINQVYADMIPLMRNHLETIGFSNTLQQSDILAIAHATPGVDACRFILKEEADFVSTSLDGAIASTTSTAFTVDSTAPFEEGDVVWIEAGLTNAELVKITEITDATHFEAIRGYAGVGPHTHTDNQLVRSIRHYGVQPVNVDGVVYSEVAYYNETLDRITDVFVDDDSTAKLNNILLTVKAPNTWNGS